jgi:hypothetical protein
MRLLLLLVTTTTIIIIIIIIIIVKAGTVSLSDQCHCPNTTQSCPSVTSATTPTQHKAVPQ